MNSRGRERSMPSTLGKRKSNSLRLKIEFREEAFKQKRAFIGATQGT